MHQGYFVLSIIVCGELTDTMFFYDSRQLWDSFHNCHIRYHDDICNGTIELTTAQLSPEQFRAIAGVIA